MIRRFRDAETEKIFQQQFSKKFQAIEKIAIRKLVHLNRAIALGDLAAIPGNQIQALKGDRPKGSTVSASTINTAFASTGTMETRSMSKLPTTTRRAHHA